MFNPLFQSRMIPWIGLPANAIFWRRAGLEGADFPPGIISLPLTLFDTNNLNHKKECGFTGPGIRGGFCHQMI
jgi:hypothetical protein